MDRDAMGGELRAQQVKCHAAVLQPVRKEQPPPSPQPGSSFHRDRRPLSRKNETRKASARAFAAYLGVRYRYGAAKRIQPPDEDGPDRFPKDENRRRPVGAPAR